MNNDIIIFDNNIDIAQMPLTQSAKLIYINGLGSLKTQYCCKVDDYYGSRYFSQILLNDVPLVQINSPGCPTCKSILSTGYGIANTNCKELNNIQNSMNEPFISLEHSIDVMKPFLYLLESGLYIIADIECYPTDGDGNFFWNVSNSPTENSSTAGILIPEDDYSFVEGVPIFLYPTQDTNCYDENRVEHYLNVIKNSENAPRCVVYNFSEFISFIIDGHHKACASSLIKQTVKCLAIIPFTGYSYHHCTNNAEPLPKDLFFSKYTVPASEIPSKFLPNYHYKKSQPVNFEIFDGTINSKEWESKYIDSAKFYPTAYEYALMVSLQDEVNFPIEDTLIAECLSNLNEENQSKLRFILFILAREDVNKLRNVAIKISKVDNIDLVLKRQVYSILTAFKDDEVESILIDYLVNNTDKNDAILPIINSYW